MVILATVATIIASQTIITGSFPLISQAIGMECSVPFNTFSHIEKDYRSNLFSKY
jgi:K+ transporter